MSFSKTIVSLLSYHLDQFFLPGYLYTPIKFLKEIWTGDKAVSSKIYTQVLKAEDVLQYNVPKFEELSLSIIYPKALNRFPDLEDYFPHYDEAYMPP